MSYADKLNECYKKALEQDDVNLAVEIAEKQEAFERLRLAGVHSTAVDARVEEFTFALDELVHHKENDTADSGYPYNFEYASHKFEVVIVDVN